MGMIASDTDRRFLDELAALRNAWNELVYALGVQGSEKPADVARALRARVEKAEKWNREMVEMAATKNNLDGYRELGAKVAAAETRAEAAEADNARLRELLGRLRKLADHDDVVSWHPIWDEVDTALTAKEPAR